jgi:CheY-like chemotaxis protein
MQTILITEDEPTVLMLAESILADAGYEILTAANGAQAIALFESGATPDLLVTDINMGDGPDGHAVAAAAVARLPSLPVIYTSGIAMTDGLQAQLVTGALFLSKPYDVPDLLQAVEEALADKK